MLWRKENSDKGKEWGGGGGKGKEGWERCFEEGVFEYKRQKKEEAKSYGDPGEGHPTQGHNDLEKPPTWGGSGPRKFRRQSVHQSEPPLRVWEPYI